MECGPSVVKQETLKQNLGKRGLQEAISETNKENNEKSGKRGRLQEEEQNNCRRTLAEHNETFKLELSRA